MKDAKTLTCIVDSHPASFGVRYHFLKCSLMPGVSLEPRGSRHKRKGEDSKNRSRVLLGDGIERAVVDLFRFESAGLMAGKSVYLC